MLTHPHCGRPQPPLARFSRHVLAITLLAAPLASSAAAPVDTTKFTPTHLVKLGVRYGTATSRTVVPQLRYEWQLRPAWSVQLGAGYQRRAYSVGYYRDLQTTFWTADVAARYYLSAPRTQALSGWYLGVGVGTIHRASLDRDNFAPFEERSSRGWSVDSRLQLGAQLALGRRLALDLYLAATTPYYFSPGDGARLQLAPEVGFSLGYRH
ncbi:DUF3575 domain-containing protein [Hymenobacter chitinivorans]|uniref:Uncharacterized protein DUF3575 n=1 Tax=Hymenobacter chitinivorans DSM 11115 TaxID=1121954 RepID=A0A2M9BRI5_9BACT|nr:DUF3575 domain-containing protein [Hymenobacter chitinivorans]PJJ60512.1 uncharacterized protein DUF3575 [Hymenobacter chitinivorans DSM 11115]